MVDEKDPAAQAGRHAAPVVAPRVALKVPGLYDVQVALEVAPEAALKVPAGHSVGGRKTKTLIGQKDPGGHRRGTPVLQA